MPQFAPDALHTMTLAVLTAVGTHPDDAAKVADSLIEGNLTGHDSHGVIRLGGYVDAVTEGVVDASARATITRRKGATGLVDANRGFGQPAMWAATELAGEIGRDLGVAAVAVSQSYHIGRVGPYVESLARQGLIGLAMANCAPSVAPFGASSRVFGTNPIAWAMPRADRDTPISHDIATAAIAEGKLKVARAKGVEVAPGLIVDKDGNPTVDPNDFYAGGAILTFGEHKGSGLSFLAQLLGRGLAGMDPSTYTGPRGVNGPVLIAIDPECFAPYDEFIERIEAQCAAVQNARPMTGTGRVLLPGDQERRARAERLITGIPIADATVEDLTRVCAMTGVKMVKAG
jgi:LDH2 family malate/lactate/ureidoglycolate dehydrogenase